jgi:hypothetical protein
VGFVVDEVALEQVFPEYLFSLPIFIPPVAPQSPSSIIWGLYNRPEVAAVPRGLSPTPLIIIKNKIKNRSDTFTQEDLCGFLR